MDGWMSGLLGWMDGWMNVHHTVSLICYWSVKCCVIYAKVCGFFLNTSPVTGNFIIMMNNLNNTIITTEQQKPSWLHKIEAFPLSREKDFVQIKNIYLKNIREFSNINKSFLGKYNEVCWKCALRITALSSSQRLIWCFQSFESNRIPFTSIIRVHQINVADTLKPGKKVHTIMRKFGKICVFVI